MAIANIRIIKKYNNNNFNFTEKDWKEFNVYWLWIDSLEAEHQKSLGEQLAQFTDIFDKQLIWELEEKLKSLNSEITDLKEKRSHIINHQLKKYRNTQDYETIKLFATFNINDRLEWLNKEIRNIKTSIFKAKSYLNLFPKNTNRDNFEELIERARLVPIETIIPGGSKLRRQGKRITITCPFHNEKTPSCSIDSEKNLFHCFGCGKGGDVITFVQELNNCDFKQAVNILSGLF